MEAGAKRKLTRKEHLANLARARRDSHGGATPRPRPEAEPDPDAVCDDEVEADAAMPMEDIEEVGAASAREEAAGKKRRYRQRLRGIGPQADFMGNWLSQVEPTSAAVEAASLAAARELVEAAVEAALATCAEEQAAMDRAAEAAAVKEKRRREKCMCTTPAAPRIQPSRVGRTFADGYAPKRPRQKRNRQGDSKPQKPRRLITAQMADTLANISKHRRFLRSHIVDGNTLNRVEWAHVNRDYLELRRVYAMHRYVQLRRDGVFARAAFEEAAKTVLTPQGKFVNWQTVRLWVCSFIDCSGKLRLDQRGRAPSTPSFLSDPDIKEQALVWLREQMRIMRAKNVDSPPLTLDRFHRWCKHGLSLSS
jgi:hypothetical protein